MTDSVLDEDSRPYPNHDAHGFTFWIDDAGTAFAARPTFSNYLRRYVDCDEACDAAELIFGELLGNVARHAPGPAEVRFCWDGAAGTLEIHDTGNGYEMIAVLPDEMSESARGLFLIAAFGGKELNTYRADDGRNVTHVVLPVRKREDTRC